MKQRLLIILALAAMALIAVTFNSCSPDDDNEVLFDESLLIGKWQQNSSRIYYVYASDHTGKTWDEDDQVTEDQAQKFEWTLVKDELTQIHIMEIGGGRIPKYYEVISLSATTLTYRDNVGSKTYTFTKQ